MQVQQHHLFDRFPFSCRYPTRSQARGRERAWGVAACALIRRRRIGVRVTPTHRGVACQAYQQVCQCDDALFNNDVCAQGHVPGLAADRSLASPRKWQKKHTGGRGIMQMSSIGKVYARRRLTLAKCSMNNDGWGLETVITSRKRIIGIIYQPSSQLHPVSQRRTCSVRHYWHVK